MPALGQTCHSPELRRQRAGGSRETRSYVPSLVRCGALRVFAIVRQLFDLGKKRVTKSFRIRTDFRSALRYEPINLIQERPKRCRDLEVFLFLALSWPHLKNNSDHVDLPPLFYRQQRGVRLLDQDTSVTLFKTTQESMGNSFLERWVVPSRRVPRNRLVLTDFEVVAIRNALRQHNEHRTNRSFSPPPPAPRAY